VIHVHGFSQKNLPIAALARAFHKPLILSLHTAGQDEPAAVRQRGRIAFWAFTSADLVLSVSPFLTARYREAGLPSNRLRPAPNGVDTDRFRPADAAERAKLRQSFGWPEADPVVLFVGFFSRDKRPDLVFRAWRQLITEQGMPVTLVYVGATATPYYEIDGSLARRIQADAAATGKGDRVRFVEPTNQIEKYLQAADVFVLPSAREAHPLALLEAMSCAMPCIASHLPDATDVMIEDGVNGRLFPVDDEARLVSLLSGLLSDRAKATLMGARARETIVQRYDIHQTAESWRAAYAEVVG
jgi:glycosyltransferase involved in cell wall biosynthesis